jgi:hypothetical protein
MAIGNTATQLTQATVNSQIAADAQYLRGVYDWTKRKFAEYNANISTMTQQSAAGFTVAADQNQLSVFIADLNRLISLFEGGSPSASNIVNDLAIVLGIG